MALKKSSPESILDVQGFFPKPVIGVDEVGRGCVAGSVFAAAVILMSNEDVHLYKDSKTLSEKAREKLSESIKTNHRFGIGIASVDEIEKLNILQAALLAMKRATKNLGATEGHVLVDGNFPIPGLDGFTQTTIVSGDSRVRAIAAASIVAKVARDHHMKELSKVYPQYEFEKHKGYGTASHLQRIAEHGPCAEHRKTFRGVREFVTQ